MKPPKMPPGDGGGSGGGSGGGGASVGEPKGSATVETTGRATPTGSASAGAEATPNKGFKPSSEALTADSAKGVSRETSGSISKGSSPGNTPTEKKSNQNDANPVSWQPAAKSDSQEGNLFLQGITGRVIKQAVRGRRAATARNKPQVANGTSSESKAERLSDSDTPAKSHEQREDTAHKEAKNKDKKSAKLSTANPEKTKSGGANDQSQGRAPATREQPNVWTKAREVLLGAEPTEPPTKIYEDEVKYAKHYALARRTDYRIMPDGYQRLPTLMEEETLLLWRQKRIFLDEPPVVEHLGIFSESTRS